MMGACAITNWKREHRRIPVEALCTELDDHQLRHAIVVDLSETGLRIQRPLGGWSPRSMQLEFEIPGVDEIVWARGEIRFDEAWRADDPTGLGLAGIVRTTGIELVAAARRHRRMLREFVMETWRQRYQPTEQDWAMRSACFRHG